MHLTIQQALKLQRDDILYHTIHRNSDGTPVRWRVNGKVKRWKTRPDQFRVPLKWGLRTYGSINEADFLKGVCPYFSLDENFALNPTQTTL